MSSLTVVLLCLIKSPLFGCCFVETCVLLNVRRGSGRPILALVSTTLTFLSASVLDLGFEAATLAWDVIVLTVVAPCVLLEAIGGLSLTFLGSVLYP